MRLTFIFFFFQISIISFSQKNNNNLSFPKYKDSAAFIAPYVENYKTIPVFGAWLSKR
jgi:hypothetical protein